MPAQANVPVIHPLLPKSDGYRVCSPIARHLAINICSHDHTVLSHAHLAPLRLIDFGQAFGNDLSLIRWTIQLVAE